MEISFRNSLLTTSPVKLCFRLFLFFVLFFVLFIVPIFGQNFSDNFNNQSPQSQPQLYENDAKEYLNSRRNKITDKSDYSHEHINRSKSYPLKHKITPAPAAANNNETQNNFIKQQEEERINKQNIIKKIPWEELSYPLKQKLSLIIQNHSVYYQLPTQAIFCDPEVYQYFIEHPDLLVGFWEALGLTQITLRETDVNRYSFVETTGTVADVGMFYRSTNCCIVYAKGEYKNPITTRKIEGETFLFLQSRYARNIENEPIIVCKLDVFVKIDSFSADLLVKLFAATLSKIADGNFEQTLGFVSHVSDTSAISASAVKRLTKSVKNVREEVRNDFIDVIDRVSVRAARRVEKRLYNYHSSSGIADDLSPVQNRAASMPRQNYKNQSNIETAVLQNESNEQKTDGKFDRNQDLTQPDVHHNKSTNKKAIFTPPKL